MIDSRASHGHHLRGLAGAVICATSLVVFAPAWAGQPVRLLPSPAKAETKPANTDPALPKAIEVPMTVQPVPLKSQPVQTEVAKPATTGNEVVQVGTLDEIDPSSIGLLDPGAGGLGTEMWRGSDRSRIELLLPRLPMGTLSATMQGLSRRLLLSAANVPDGKPVAPSFVGLRVERLAAGGQTASVNQLLRLVPARLADPAFARAEMDGLLLGGDRAKFCTQVDGLVGEDPDSYWLKGLAFCKALEGEIEAVELAVELLRDSGETSDEAFFTLADALTGQPDVTLASLIDPTPLQLAMLRAAKLPLPADAVPGARPGILGAEATWANADIAVRLEAAEKAEAAGVINARALAQIYAGIEFSDEELTDWANFADLKEGPRAHALLYQAATIESDPQKRAKALVMAWRRTARDGGFGTMARVTSDAVRTLVPGDELVWASADIIRALIAVGDYQTATRWFELVRQIALAPRPLPIVVDDAETSEKTNTTTNPLMGAMPTLAAVKPAPPPPPPPARPTEAAALAVLETWPLMQLADFDGKLPWSTPVVSAWWPGLVKKHGKIAAAERGALLFTLFDSLGYSTGDDLWNPLLQGPLTVTSYLPSPALSRALAVSANEGRVGETVLLALLALGDVGPAGADPSTLQDVIVALRFVGLDVEARLIAIEAALGRGL